MAARTGLVAGCQQHVRKAAVGLMEPVVQLQRLLEVAPSGTKLVLGEVEVGQIDVNHRIIGANVEGMDISGAGGANKPALQKQGPDLVERLHMSGIPVQDIDILLPGFNKPAPRGKKPSVAKAQVDGPGIPRQSLFKPLQIIHAFRRIAGHDHSPSYRTACEDISPSPDR